MPAVPWRLGVLPWALRVLCSQAAELCALPRLRHLQEASLIRCGRGQVVAVRTVDAGLACGSQPHAEGHCPTSLPLFHIDPTSRPAAFRRHPRGAPLASGGARSREPESPPTREGRPARGVPSTSGGRPSKMAAGARRNARRRLLGPPCLRTRRGGEVAGNLRARPRYRVSRKISANDFPALLSEPGSEHEEKS